ncbi:MAG: hypothetical protein ACRCW3_00175 [Metamycoplasmataceae bacterium]
MTFFAFLAAYIAASVASQFLTSTPVELMTIAGVPIWMPLSALTLVPLVDVLRSFTQDAAEKTKLSFRKTAGLMLGLSLAASGLCVIFAGLPLPIFVGVLLAVTIGGIVDVLVFRRMGKWFKTPAARMMFSNFAATIVGSGIVFFVAFTDLLFVNNPLAKPLFDVTVGWLAQSAFIWMAGSVIAWGLQLIKGGKNA